MEPRASSGQVSLADGMSFLDRGDILERKVRPGFREIVIVKPDSWSTLLHVE